MSKADKLDSIEVHWPAPSNRVQKFEDLPVDAYVTLTEEYWSGGFQPLPGGD